MKKIAIITALCFVTLSLSLYASSDFKILPGSICKAHYGSQQSRLTYYSGAVENVSSYDTWVICPLIRDHMEYGDVGDSIAPVVYVNDKHYDDNIKCYHYKMHRNGSWSRGVRSSSNTGLQSMGNLNRAKTDSDSYYFLYCKLPERYSGNNSSIRNIKLAEYYAPN